MKKFTGTAVLLAALLVALGALSGAATGKPDAGGPKLPPPVTIQILNVSDWHGNLDPFGSPALGGAWNISARWQQDRAAFPTLTLTAGDDFGATPPLSSFFNEEPSVKAQRLMGIQVGALGNHNFDRGVGHLQQMINLAGAESSSSAPGQPFSYVSANLKNLDGNLTGVEPMKFFKVGGLKVAVIGITNEEAPSVVLPGSFGTVEVTDGIAAANKYARHARQAQADVVLVITHKGIRSMVDGVPAGELIDFANGLEPGLVDVVFGDHTDVQFSGTINGVLVHENRSFGGTYAKTILNVQPGRGNADGFMISKSVSFVTPTPPTPGLQNGNTACPAAPTFCDQAIVDMLVPYRQQLAALLDGQVGTSAGIFVRGGNIERRQEIPLGDLMADGMRWRYGTQLGFMNSGGIRMPMPSCSYAPVNTALKRPCSGYAAGTPYDLVLGDIFAVLPFGNILNTRTVTGAQLWAALENGVSRIAADGTGVDGRFPQISGFKFTFHYLNAVGSRVTSVQLSDGTPIPNSASATYTMTLPNFVNLGGDGYTVFADGQGATQELDAVVMKEYMAFAGPSFDPASFPLDRITKLP